VSPPQPNRYEPRINLEENLGVYCCTMSSGIPFRQAGRGVGRLLRSVMGPPIQHTEEGPPVPVDSIDLLIVGLGLLVVLLVLLRR
jgi:hypothetical protein